MEDLRPVLDSVGYAIWVADCQLRILYANRTAADAAGLDNLWAGRDAGEAFSRRGPAAGLVAQACEGQSVSEIVTLQSGERWSFFAQPLRLDRSQACALVSGRRTFASAYDAAKLQELFALSPGQGRVCELLSGGATFGETARRMGISISTARTHFREALVRTGARNLRQFLALVASLPQTIDR